MKKNKIISTLLILTIATISAIAQTSTYSPSIYFYQVGIPNTASENCKPVIVQKVCNQLGTGCVVDIDDVGTDIQLYASFEAIQASNRYRCINSIQED